MPMLAEVGTYEAIPEMPVGRFFFSLKHDWQPRQPRGARRLRRFSLRWRLDAFFSRWLVPMYPCARCHVDAADPTNQSENRSNVRSPDSSRRRCLTGYTVPASASPLVGYDASRRGGDLTPSLVTGPSPCIHVPAAAWILQTLLTRARTAPMSVVPIPAANAA